MSSVVLSGDTSGTVTVTVPAVAGTNTITLPAVTGTAVIGSSAVSAVGQIPFSTNGTSFTPTAKIVSGTSVAASGSSVDFTSIPSWVKRITVQIVNLGYAAAGSGTVRIGSGSLASTGYSTSVIGMSPTPSITFSNITTGLGILNANAASGTTTITGQMFITNVTGNLWVATSNLSRNGDSVVNISTSYITLGGTLDRISLIASTSTFNAGTINILYE